MAFISKELLLSEAEKRGIDLTGLSWHEQQKVVQEAMKADEPVNEKPKLIGKEIENQYIDEIAELKAEIARLKAETGEPEASKDEAAKEIDLPKQRIILAPQIQPTNIQLIKYDEELGQDIDVEEVYYDVSEHARVATAKDMSTGTYRIKGTKNRKVIAQSTIPKQNAGVDFKWWEDDFVVITDPSTGKKGYPWTHQSYHNVKQLLMDTGYYFEYKDLFKAALHPENVWYSAGKMLVCDINMVRNVMHEIETKEQQKARLGF